jgi:DNA-binding protein HU-beta
VGNQGVREAETLAVQGQCLTWDAKTSLIAVTSPRRQEAAMNKAELIEAVATAAGLEKKQAEAAVGAFTDSVVAKTKSGEPVSIFGFGTFKPTARAARMGRNPQTGVAVKIAAAKGVKFQPATAFKATLNTRGTKKAAAAKKTTAPAKKATAPAKKTTAPAKKATAPAKKTTAPATKATAPAKKATAAPTKVAAAVKKAPAVKKVTAPAKKAVTAAKKR